MIFCFQPFVDYGILSFLAMIFFANSEARPGWDVLSGAAKSMGGQHG